MKSKIGEECPLGRGTCMGEFACGVDASEAKKTVLDRLNVALGNILHREDNHELSADEAETAREKVRVWCQKLFERYNQRLEHAGMKVSAGQALMAGVEFGDDIEQLVLLDDLAALAAYRAAALAAYSEYPGFCEVAATKKRGGMHRPAPMDGGRITVDPAVVAEKRRAREARIAAAAAAATYQAGVLPTIAAAAPKPVPVRAEA